MTTTMKATISGLVRCTQPLLAIHYPYSAPKKLCILCSKPNTPHPNHKTPDHTMNPENTATTTSPHPRDADRTCKVLSSAFGGLVSEIY